MVDDARKVAEALIRAAEMDWPSSPRYRAAVLEAAADLRAAIAGANNGAQEAEVEALRAEVERLHGLNAELLGALQATRDAQNFRAAVLASGAVEKLQFADEQFWLAGEKADRVIAKGKAALREVSAK